MKLFRLLFSILFITLVLATVFLESNPGKKFVEKLLLQTLAKSGLDVKVGSIHGNLPYNMELRDVSINDTTAESITIKISLFHLLKRELYVESLIAEGVVFGEMPQNKTVETKRLPLTITVHSYDLKSSLIEIQGDAKLRRNGSGFGSAKISRIDFPEAQVKASISWKKDGLIDLDLTINSPTLSAFAPWFKTEDEGSLKLQGWIRGYKDEFIGKLNGRFDAKKMSIPILERNWLLRSRIVKTKSHPIKFLKVLLSSAGLRYSGSIDLNETNHFAKAQGEIRAELEPGLIFVSGVVEEKPEGLAADLNWRSDSLENKVHKASGHLVGLWANKAFIGQTNASGDFLEQTWKVSSPVAIRPDTSLLFENIEIESPLAKASGNLAIVLPEKIPVGQFQIERSELELIARYKPSIPISGEAIGSISFQNHELFFDLTGKNILYDGVRIPAASLSRDESSLQINATDIQYRNLLLNSISYVQVDKAFVFGAIGNEKFPLILQGSGTLDQSSITIDQLDGKLLNEPISLKTPTKIGWSPEQFSISPSILTYGTGSIDLYAERSAEKTEAKLKLNSVPLGLLSFNPLEVPVSGKLFLDSTFHQADGRTTAELTASIQKGKLLIEGMQTPIELEANLKMNLGDEQLTTKASVQVNENELLALEADIPFQMDHLEFTIPGEKNGTGHLALHGRAEDVLDFFNLGTHRFEGNVNCDLSFQGKLDHPRVTGKCEITDGHYENYLTGTELTGLSAQFVGQDNKLILESLNAQDAKKNGSLTGTGEIAFAVQENFPFHFALEFTDLNVVQIDLVTATAQGQVTVDGNILSSQTKGKIEIVKSEIAIPDKIPRSFPDLQVVYKNGPKRIPHQKAQKKAYPLNLDLQVSAPEAIHIDGRGLHTVWRGDFHVGGTSTAPLGLGKLALMSGEFVFAGKQFKLIDGAIALQGKPYELPHIDISALTHEGGVAITARIRGPINRPQVTFQSSPPLPLSAILSYLIFGKDLSDVSGLQALQLAGTVASIAGEGPDILEMTRKSLGIDRLQIVMTPSSLNEGADTVSLEVGKVIFPGFLVTVRQGAEDAGPDMGIQVDIGNGFTLGLESQQQPEQGKFSLNWNLNY